jgi:acylphosphatase
MHAFISGYVQGVSFRYYTKKQANSLNLKGFVRNLPDGRVEVVAQGPKRGLERLAEWLHHGPDSASVKKVEIAWEKPEKEFEKFGLKF